MKRLVFVPLPILVLLVIFVVASVVALVQQVVGGAAVVSLVTGGAIFGWYAGVEFQIEDEEENNGDDA